MSIYLYTGEGAGKTTNALGLALRSVGHKHKVIIIQFMKWWKNLGEVKIQKRLTPYYEIYQFGRRGWKGKKNLTLEDKQSAERGLEFAVQILSKKPDLLILDEINLAVAWKLLDEQQVLNYLRTIPKNIDVVLTGRYASKKLISIADYVNEIRVIKMPLKMTAKAGIQY